MEHGEQFSGYDVGYMQRTGPCNMRSDSRRTARDIDLASAHSYR